MDFKLLSELQKIQEEKLKEQVKKIKMEQRGQGTENFVNNKGEKYSKNNNKL
jgi:hypothetical protein